MTWRERIQAARESGEFTTNDHRLWSDGSTCPAAEVAAGYGVNSLDGMEHQPWCQLWALGDYIGKAMRDNDVRKVERLLDAIEDRALQLKRAAGSMHAPASAESDEAAS